MGLDLFHPVLQSIERLQVMSGIDHNDSHGSFVVSLSDGFESLLPSSVPNLHSYLFAINFDSFDLEINAFD